MTIPEDPRGNPRVRLREAEVNADSETAIRREAEEEVVEVTLDEAIAMVERGEIVDAKTVLLLRLALFA